MMVRLGLAGTRSLAQALVMEGRVSVEGRRVDKAGFLVAEDARIELAGPARPFVSRGGMKLQAALESFPLEVGGATALDVGAGTGGFTDCLLKKGAQSVIAVDVGHGQIDHGLRLDPRVTVIEGLNARFLTPGDLPGPVDLAVMDVSFISATMILPNLPAVLRGRDVVVLVKPQFEVGRELVGKGGIVRDPASWRSALQGVIDGAGRCGFGVAGIVPSPVRGAAGNQEFLLHLLLRRPGNDSPCISIRSLVNAALAAAEGPKP